MKHKLSFIIALTFGICISTYSQQFIRIADSMQGAKFSDIVDEIEKQWEGKSKDKYSGYKQYQRWKFYQSTRLDENGYLQNVSKNNFDEFLEEENSSKLKAGEFQGNWASLSKTTYDLLGGGYGGGNGRVNCLAFDPSNTDIIYAGTPGGGLWKSEDAGGSWNPLTDGMTRLSISGIAIDPTSDLNNRTIYILTGDGDGYNVASIGVFVSYDNGNTWLSTGLGEETGRSYKLLMHPTDYNTLYVASEFGVFKTTDGGLNWALTVPVGFAESDRVTDIEFHQGNPNILFATTYIGKVYKTTDAGQNWLLMEKETTGIPTSGEVFAYRAAVAVTPADPNYVYVVYGFGIDFNKFAGLYVSTDGGNTFSLQSDSPNIMGWDPEGYYMGSQAWYDLAIAVSPTDPNVVQVGAVNSWRSLDAGVTWENTSYWVEPDAPQGNYNHADVHAMEYANGILYAGTDGGVFTSSNDAGDWENISAGLDIMQFYKIGNHPTDPNLILGGAQDNGSMLMDEGSTMHQWFGADGFECFFDPDNEGTYYGEAQKGYLVKTINGGDSTFLIAPDSGRIVGEWSTPFYMDPHNSSTLYACYRPAIYKSIDGGATWTDFSKDRGGITRQGGQYRTGSYKQVVVSKTSEDYIYILGPFELFVTKDGGETLDTISFELPWDNSFLSIAVDPYNVNNVWAYNNTNVYQTIDGGDTWTDITGSLPDVAFNTIVYQEGTNGLVYIGTDIGVYYRDNTMNDWIEFNNGLVPVEIFELEIFYPGNKLRAATYGRGVWESDLAVASCDINAVVYAPDPTVPTSLKSATAPAVPGPPVTIEAESFATTGGTYDDAYAGGPGYGVNRASTNINYVNRYDWAEYNLPSGLESGIYEVDYYISTPSDNSEISLSIDGGTPIVDAVPNNGHWDTYTLLEASENITILNTNTNLTITGSSDTEWQWNLDRIVITKIAEIGDTVSGVTVSPASVSIYPGETAQLTATVLPESAANKNVTWSTSNSAVATVDANGLITATGVGNAIITVTTEDGGYTASSSVTVEDPNAITVVVEAEDYFVPEGQTGQFEIYTVDSITAIKIYGHNGPSYSVDFPVSGRYRIKYHVSSAIDNSLIKFEFIYENIILNSVPNTGGWDSFIELTSYEEVNVQAGLKWLLLQGASDITGQQWNLDKIEFVRVGDEGVPATGVDITEESVELFEGQSQKLTATLLPEGAMQRAVYWSSTDTNIVKVDAEGNVMAISKGTAQIIAQTTYPTLSDTCTVNVYENIIDFVLEAENFVETGGTYDGFQIYNIGDITATNWNQTGDWAEYEITITESGEYQVEYFLGTTVDGAAIEFSVNSVPLMTDNVPNNGDWDVFESLIASKRVVFGKGEYIIRITGAGTHGWEWNMDKFRVQKMSEVCVEAVPTVNLKTSVKELTGTYAGAMPGLIQESNELDEEGEISMNKDAITVYPNPASASISIDFETTNSLPITIELLNVVGEVQAAFVNSEILPEGNYNLKYDISEFEAGIYFVKYVQGSEISVVNFVIQ